MIGIKGGSSKINNVSAPLHPLLLSVTRFIFLSPFIPDREAKSSILTVSRSKSAGDFQIV
jgi:hypothetical protein